MAMGATAGDILRGVIREGMVLAGAGLTIGVLAAFAVAGVLRSLLIGVSSHDPVTFGALGALLVLVTLVACLIPASRAARTAPASAIRDG
jgi:ABC-type antimicrobial peptide transport system permease subunit